MSPAQCNILVLEDEPAILRLVTAALHASGFENIFAGSSIGESRAIWNEHGGNFDLLLTDFSLPDGSATSFIAELRHQKPGLAVIIMSGFGQEMLGLEEEGIRSVSVVQKPFRPSELCLVVSEVLNAPLSAESPFAPGELRLT